MPLRQHLQETSFRLTSSDVTPEIALASQRGSCYFLTACPRDHEKVTVVWSNGELHEVDIDHSERRAPGDFLSLYDPIFGHLYVHDWSLRSAYLHDGMTREDIPA